MSDEKARDNVAWLSVAAGAWRRLVFASQIPGSLARGALAMAWGFSLFVAFMPALVFLGIWPLFMGFALQAGLENGWTDRLVAIMEWSCVGLVLALLTTCACAVRGRRLVREGLSPPQAWLDLATQGWESLKSQVGLEINGCASLAWEATMRRDGGAWGMLGRAAWRGALATGSGALLGAPLGVWAALKVMRAIALYCRDLGRGAVGMMAEAWNVSAGGALRRWWSSTLSSLEREGAGTKELAAAERLALRWGSKKGEPKSKDGPPTRL